MGAATLSLLESNNNALLLACFASIDTHLGTSNCKYDKLLSLTYDAVLQASSCCDLCPSQALTVPR